MHGARRSADEPPEPDLGAEIAAASAVRDRAAVALARVEELIEAARDGMPLPDGLDRRALAVLGANLRHYGGETASYVRALERVKLGQVFGTAAESWVRADEREQIALASPRRRHAHRKPNPRQLTLIRGDGRPAALGALGGLPALKVALGLTAAAAGIAVAAPSLVPPLLGSPARVAHHHAPAFAGVLPVGAVPLGGLPQPSYTPRHARQPSANAATASPVASPPSFASPAPSLPSAVPSVVVSGSIDLATVHLALGGQQAGQVTFTASGGPVEWRASASDPALNLSDDGGILGAGQSVTLYVSVSPGSLAGTGTVVITAGDGQQETVFVTWVAVPDLGL